MAGASRAGRKGGLTRLSRESGPNAFLENLRQPMSPLRKLGLIARNLGRRRRGHGCCGHPGEPGC